MTRKELSVIQARIEEELTNIDLLLSELQKRGYLQVEDDARKKNLFAEDGFMLRAIGSVLHDFYVIAENIFEIIGREIDESLPQGNDWHIQLLRQMALEISRVRTAVISKDTSFKLDKYRAFRHVFRNVYGYNLDAVKIKELLEDFPQTVEHFRQDLKLFLKNMEAIIE